MSTNQIPVDSLSICVFSFVLIINEKNMAKCSLTAYFSGWHRCWLTWSDFWSIFHILERRSHLEGLLKWSKKKKLVNPHRLYQRHLIDIELNLSRKCHRHPSLAKWAYFLYELKMAIYPSPKYYAKGSAAIYRLR